MRRFGAVSGPLDAIKQSTDEPVIVRLRDGREFRGELDSCDNHMNLVLNNAKEVEGDEGPRETMIIRGDNIVYVSP